MSRADALGPGKLTIGPTGSAKQLMVQCTKAALTPSIDTGESINFLDGTAEAGEVTITWALDVTLSQDYAPSSLNNWLLEEAGNEHPFTFQPRNGTDYAAYSGRLTVVPGSIGGDVKTKNTSDISFPCADKPTVASGTD